MNEKLATAYISSREAALLLNVSVSTVLNMVESGTLKAWRTEGGHRRIERASVAERLATRQGKPSGDPDALKVLVIEDDAPTCETYQLQFASWRLPVKLRVAMSGVEGLIEIGREMPDLLLLDLMMPDVDGFAVLRHVDQVLGHHAMDIIVVSSLDAKSIAEAGGLPPGVAFWPKPLEFAQLRGYVAGRLAARQKPTAA